ncbi:hypothetical protein EIP86_005254 [Pleurotus ostreatoroseus]|nr:hypothetical protein EIP86_005254 [Pleurotus ostreatoroseus]
MVAGGAYLASELARTISKRRLGSNLGIAVRAFTAGIKSRLMKVVAGLLFLLGLFVLIIVRVSMRQEHLIHAMRARLNEPSVFPWTSQATPRLYVYSDADEMVPADAVEEHIADAKQKGRIVHVEKYHGSLHVSHARKDPERYWGAVQGLWSEAVKLSKGNN